jgi:3'(2'), 5'-bisphosphate nucleotidase
VDPLDGTKEFLKHQGEFTVNIGLVENKKPILGIVYAPALDLLYYAARGLGAHKQIGSNAPRKIKTRQIRAGQPVRIVTSRYHGTEQSSKYFSHLGKIEEVRVGSSLKFCYVAEGKAHLYPRSSGSMEWDVAAGDCVYRHATNSVLNTSPLKYNKRTLRNGPFIIGDAKGAKIA